MEGLNKIKGWLDDNKSDIILGLSFFLVAIISFGLGRFSILVENQRKEPIQIENYNHQTMAPGETSGVNGKTLGVEEKAAVYVGSKNSNKYHLPNCPGALRIKEENKIWFSSREEAENLGYTPASNCDGL